MCDDHDTGPCTGCGCAGEPAEMKRMAAVLGVDALLAGPARSDAAARCADCADRDRCADWLPAAEIRGADHAPGFCRNADVFDVLASEAPSTL